MTYRCSSLPLLTTCPPAAVRNGEPLIASNGSEARLGTAVHAWLSDRIRNGIDVDPAEMARHLYPDVDAEECAKLCWQGWKCWQQIQQHFPKPETEVYMEHEQDGLCLTGHADVMSVIER